MSCVVGIDISSFTVDLVRLDENTNAADRSRIQLEGAGAFDRLRTVAGQMPASSWWDDVYLVAIEMPESRMRQSLRAQLPVFGAVVAAIPERLPVWAIHPAEWRKTLGLKGNASKGEAAFAVDALRGGGDIWPQDALDAYAVAYYARETNARAIHERSAA